MIPDHQSGWTTALVEQMCRDGVSEGERHDFKWHLPEPQVLTKLCCAFANTYGGFIILGVKQRDGAFVAEGIEPGLLELFADFRRKLRCEPEISVEAPKQLPVGDNSKQLYIFEVRRSARRPHLPLRQEERFFWKRLGSVCERMSREEVRAQMVDEEGQRDKLGLLLLELQDIRGLLATSASMAAGRWDGTIFSFEILNRTVVEAYPLLKSAPGVVPVLGTLKRQLMVLNANKQKLIAVLAGSYDPTYKAAVADEHTALAKGSQPMVEQIFDQVQRELRDVLGIVIPA